MQCGCPQCGAFMGQVERGFDSRCVCPACGYSCSACLGTNTVMKKGEYKLPENFETEIGRVQYDLAERSREAMDKALWYLGTSAKTESQMTKYLEKKGYEQDVIAVVMQKLTGYGYIDDEAYAKSYVESASSNKGIGKRAMAQKLWQRGIDKETAAAAIGELDDGDELKNAVEWAKKLSAKLTEPDPRKKRDKLTRRLISKGFSYEVINAALNSVKDDEWD